MSSRVIVGPSGCGKSSLLYLVAGLEERTGGEISVNGKRVDGPGPDRGMVFQSYTLFPWLTVRAERRIWPEAARHAAAERRRDRRSIISTRSASAQFADHYPKQLSGGMMQRVAIARALANDPRGAADGRALRRARQPDPRTQCRSCCSGSGSIRKKTVLFVTHDIDEAILLGDRVLVMTARPGRIKEEIRVGFSRPRSMDLVMEPNFIAMKREILELLKNDEDDEH